MYHQSGLIRPAPAPCSCPDYKEQGREGGTCKYHALALAIYEQTKANFLKKKAVTAVSTVTASCKSVLIEGGGVEGQGHGQGACGENNE